MYVELETRFASISDAEPVPVLVIDAVIVTISPGSISCGSVATSLSTSFGFPCTCTARLRKANQR